LCPLTKTLSPRADRAAIERLLKTARGQIDGVLKMMDEGKYCMDVANQVLAAQAVLRKANREILKGHMEGCLASAFAVGDRQEQQEKIQEILDLMDSMGK